MESPIVKTDLRPSSDQHVPASTSSLSALESNEQREVLNIVDSLRQSGLEGIISLPQIVVCGDQSSGKSSVLEAITEIPFPRKENLCTRFATEIILRQSPTPFIRTRIIPEKTRPQYEQAKLEEFRECISDFCELPGLIDKATKLMGLGETDGLVANAFASDVLSIEISGPDRPQLTLVDLPGLIHSENKTQSSEDIQLVRNLVERYISNPRTIILAIISAKNDYANQIILKIAREFDLMGARTLGIITKPDVLRPDSGSETAFIDLAMNEDIFFELGWHALRNRDFDEMNSSFEQRNQFEKAFFSKGNWLKLPRAILGIESLRVRLSDLLFRHIKAELPKLREELESTYKETLASLETLGQKRSTLQQQKEYLMHLSLQFYDLTKAAVNSHYESGYFEKIDTESAFGSTFHERRLRAMVQFLNLKFATAMRSEGHKYAFDCPGSSDLWTRIRALASEEETNSESDEHGTSVQPPEILGEHEAQKWVKEVLVRTRGQELPGNFNPLLIGELFWEQSKKWSQMAEEYLDDVSKYCSNFVIDLLRHICPSDVCSRIHQFTVVESLKKRVEAGEAELKRLLKDEKRYPMSYNHDFSMRVQKTRREKFRVELEHGTTRTTDKHGNTTATMVDYEVILRRFQEKVESDTDYHSCREALDDLQAFYSVALTRFIDNVAVQVIERHIVDDLEQVFSPLVVTALDDDVVSNLASEPSTTVRQREHLEGRRCMLEKGRKTFRDILRNKMK